MVSVIVPVYQAQDFLKKCIDSVLAQSYTDWELILVDDGSTDNSAQICEDYAQRDGRVRVMRQQNAGVSSARNAGISGAQGEFLVFLDSDDWFLPNMLETLVRLMSMNGADAAGCGHNNIWPDGREKAESAPLPGGVYEKNEVLDKLVRPLLRDRVEGQKLINGYIWRFCYKAEIIKKNRISFSGAYLEDEIFLIEYFCLAERLVVTDEPLYGYYQNPSSVTRRYLKDYVNTFRDSFELKKRLVERYWITGIEGWQEHTCWAGLLIAVGNVFAPGREVGFLEKRRELVSLLKEPEFSAAVENVKPRAVAGNKALVVKLIRARQLTALSLLYTVKNRNKG